MIAVASVQETKQTFSAEDDFEIIRNKLQIKASIKNGFIQTKAELSFAWNVLASEDGICQWLKCTLCLGLMLSLQQPF